MKIQTWEQLDVLVKQYGSRKIVVTGEDWQTLLKTSRFGWFYDEEEGTYLLTYLGLVRIYPNPPIFLKHTTLDLTGDEPSEITRLKTEEGK